MLRMNEVVEVTGLSRATIYRYIKKGRFPKQFQMTDRTTGFRTSEINAWLDGLKQVA